MNTATSSDLCLWCFYVCVCVCFCVCVCVCVVSCCAAWSPEPTYGTRNKTSLAINTWYKDIHYNTIVRQSFFDLLALPKQSEYAAPETTKKSDDFDKIVAKICQKAPQKIDFFCRNYQTKNRFRSSVMNVMGVLTRIRKRWKYAKNIRTNQEKWLYCRLKVEKKPRDF